MRSDNYQKAKEENVYGQSVTKLQNNWSPVNCSGLQEISDTITALPWFSRARQRSQVNLTIQRMMRLQAIRTMLPSRTIITLLMVVNVTLTIGHGKNIVKTLNG